MVFKIATNAFYLRVALVADHNHHMALFFILLALQVNFGDQWAAGVDGLAPKPFSVLMAFLIRS